MATVLIVDDRPKNRNLLVSVLGYGGHRLLEASDGAEALRTIYDERPDLVITDLVMPDIDGCELVRRLRHDPSTRNTAVIFYTATDEDEKARNLAHACGVSFVLTKPAEPAQILSTVSAALEQAQQPIDSSSSEEFDRDHLRALTTKLSEKVEALEAFNARLTKLLECGVEIASENEAKGLCRMVCSAAREIVGCKYCAIGMLRRGELSR